ncbi:hypothetical protein DCAR_0311388 [Daucus carota subsp. sativus]|uniref:Uncharacterized protein n=1 Tax=Daucus carota subsp. sativus TaxID=79200 RepID=A0AAF1AQV5_DAUCS|nr:hypothetical protein DCAR_0311388 [Daucus carota subsp. sativus]
MNAIKVVSDELALLGDPVKHEDLIERVLEGLGDNNYQGVIDAINARGSTISFAELHEKLINRELAIKAQPILDSFPASAYVTSNRQIQNYQPRHTTNQSHQYRNNYTAKSATTGTKQFLGRCHLKHILLLLLFQPPLHGSLILVHLIMPPKISLISLCINLMMGPRKL